MNADLVHLLEEFSKLALECDGLSRVLSYTLYRRGIDHGFVVGRLDVDGKTAARPHAWLRVGEETVDFRARMWAGEHDYVPNGVFLQKDYPRVAYVAERADFPAQPVSKTVYDILVTQTHEHAKMLRAMLDSSGEARTG